MNQNFTVNPLRNSALLIDQSLFTSNWEKRSRSLRFFSRRYIISSLNGSAWNGCANLITEKKHLKSESNRKLKLVFVSSQAHKKGILKITSIKFTKSILFNDENAQYYFIPNVFIHQRIYECIPLLWMHTTVGKGLGDIISDKNWGN